MKKNKKKTWRRPRHKVITELARFVLKPYIRIRYGIKVEKFREPQRRNYLILLNHQTPFDQFFAGLAFRDPIYYMATEDIFSMGWISSVLRWVVAPIPIKKQTTDIQAVMNCIKIAREGGSIAIAPEGNRSYSGKTEYMNPAIAGMAKKLGLPILLFRIEGGYGAEPRWSDVIRKGNMRAFVARVIEPEEAKAMSNDELMDAIQEGLYVNEACTDFEYHHKKLAEYMERMVYICPKCGLSRFQSQEDEVQCLRCKQKVRYLPTKELQGIDEPFPFRFANDWYEYQKDFINNLDVTTMTATPIYEDVANVSEVIVYKRKELLEQNASIRLYGDRVCLGQQEYSFDDISTIAVLGRNKLNIYHKSGLYQLKGDKRFNALKYVHIFYRYKNIRKGDTDGNFLGL